MEDRLFTYVYPNCRAGTSGIFPLRYGRNNSVRKLSSETGEKLMELVSEALPGGIMGSYLEEGYPLYTINDTMLNILGYTYEELVDATNEKMMNIIYPPDQKWVEESIEKQFHEKMNIRWNTV